MSLYNKLGGKTAAQLPVPPTGLQTIDGTTAITVTWDNNNILTGGTNVIQAWDSDNEIWVDSGQYASDATSGVTTGTTVSVEKEYNIRVSVLLNDRYSPSQVTTGTIIPSPYPLSGLISRWQFEDDLTDSYGSYDLSSNGTPNYITGLVGKAVRFNNNQKINSTETELCAILAGTNSYTKIGWVKIDGFLTLSSVYASSGKDYVEIGTSIKYADRTGTRHTTISPAYNTWYHIAITYDGTTSKFYIDSDLKYSGADSTSLSVSEFVLGLNTYSEYSNFDQTYIYNRALTTVEIAKLYNSGAGI